MVWKELFNNNGKWWYGCFCVGWLFLPGCHEVYDKLQMKWLSDWKMKKSINHSVLRLGSIWYRL